MSQKSRLTTKVTKYSRRMQAYVRDYESFDTFVFYLGVLSGKVYPLGDNLFNACK